MTATQDVPSVGQIIGTLAGKGVPHLTPFEGRAVSVTSVTVPNAGGGVREALKVDPVELHQGERVTLVLECEVDKIQFHPLKDVDELERVHALKAVRATFIGGATVREALDAQDRRIEEAQGVQQLPFDHGDGEDPDVEPDPETDDLAAEAGA